MLMPRAELLAPAGNPAALRAAVSAGADAVYLGAAAFGARAGAGFSQEELQQAVHYAHLYGRRVYVTVNTLVKQAETGDLRRLLAQIDALGSDAVIVQDLGVLSLIKSCFGQLPVHASTQMSIHNAAGAEVLKTLGVSRVVAARECSLPTLAAIAATGIQTEVFIHGALCVAQSGQCLLSSQIGGRSSNRGRCAQPCRLGYQFDGQQGAWLSPRDLCLLDQLQDLLAAGVGSFKIEGRLKRPEYVAVVTGVYRRALDQLLAGKKPAASSRAAKRELLQIFNRGGFTPGYAAGREDADIIYPRRVAHEGLPMGEVTAVRTHRDVYLADVRLAQALQDGDGLQVRGQTEQDLIYSGPARDKGGEATLRLHAAAAAGDAVFRLADSRQLDSARLLSQNDPPLIALQGQLAVQVNQPIQLQVHAGGVAATVTGAVAAPAKSAPLTYETAWNALSKAGDSPCAISTLALLGDEAAFVTVAALNDLRRRALGAWVEAKVAAHVRPPASDWALPEVPTAGSLPAHQLYVRCWGGFDLARLRAAGAQCLITVPLDYRLPALQQACGGLLADDLLQLPRQCGDDALRQIVQTAAQQGVALAADNVSHLNAAPSPLTTAASGIPAWNSHAAQVLQRFGCQTLLLSPEISLEEAALLRQACGADIRLALPVYGRQVLMVLNHCPTRTALNKHSGHDHCILCQRKPPFARFLADAAGKRYPLRALHLPSGCLNLLFNHTPLALRSGLPAGPWLIDLTDESQQQAESIVRFYAQLLRGEQAASANLPVEYVGRALLGVE